MIFRNEFLARTLLSGNPATAVYSLFGVMFVPNKADYHCYLQGIINCSNSTCPSGYCCGPGVVCATSSDENCCSARATFDYVYWVCPGRSPCGAAYNVRTFDVTISVFSSNLLK